MATETPELSKAELDILRPIWRDGAMSVRDVHNDIGAATGWAYTTTKTVMDRMVGKGLLRRDQRHGAFIYIAQISRPAGLARTVRYFADRVLETDHLAVVAMFRGSGSLSDAEVAELTELVEGLEDTPLPSPDKGTRK